MSENDHAQLWGLLRDTRADVAVVREGMSRIERVTTEKGVENQLSIEGLRGRLRTLELTVEELRARPVRTRAGITFWLTLIGSVIGTCATLVGGVYALLKLSGAA